MAQECQYCGDIFSNKRNMKRHQKTVRHCLDIQQAQGVQIEPETHQCSCGAVFTQKATLTRHQLASCSSKRSLNVNKSASLEAQEEKPVSESESMVKDRLVKSLVQTEVRVQNGIIDVVTRDEIIEIKKVSLWKHALGQILAYALEPECQGRNKRIHLFGSVKDKIKIVTCCAHYGVSVSFDETDQAVAENHPDQLQQDATSSSLSSLDGVSKEGDVTRPLQTDLEWIAECGLERHLDEQYRPRTQPEKGTS